MAISGQRFRISGDVKWFYLGKRPSVGKLPLPEHVSQGLIRKTWCAVANGDLILAYRLDYFGPEGDFRGGAVSRLATAPGKVRWTVELQGNIGEPLLAGNSIYVSGTGFVGKLDANSGHFSWSHAGLYRSPGVYVSFARPIRRAGNVVFPARHYNSGNAIPEGWPPELIVDDASGRILKGKPE